MELDGIMDGFSVDESVYWWIDPLTCVRSFDLNRFWWRFVSPNDLYSIATHFFVWRRANRCGWFFYTKLSTKNRILIEFDWKQSISRNHFLCNFQLNFVKHPIPCLSLFKSKPTTSWYFKTFKTERTSYTLGDKLNWVNFQLMCALANQATN